MKAGICQLCGAIGQSSGGEHPQAPPDRHVLSMDGRTIGSAWAHFKDGVLKVTLPKSAAVLPKSVEIKVA